MIVVLARDLIIATRIADAAARIGRSTLRIDDPAALPEPDGVRLAFVDWAEREAGWATALRDWMARATKPDRARIVLFGPHTDLDAHRAARDARLGPMIARSKLVGDLAELVGAG